MPMELTIDVHDLKETHQRTSPKGNLKSEFPLFALRPDHFQPHVQQAINIVGSATYWAPHGHYRRIYRL